MYLPKSLLKYILFFFISFFRDLEDRYLLRLTSKVREKLFTTMNTISDYFITKSNHNHNDPNESYLYELGNLMFNCIQYDCLRRLRYYWLPRWNDLERQNRILGFLQAINDYSRQNLSLMANRFTKLTKICAAHKSKDEDYMMPKSPNDFDILLDENSNLIVRRKPIEMDHLTPAEKEERIRMKLEQVRITEKERKKAILAARRRQREALKPKV
ncbi:hypothetical protein Smp_208040 [Schistosoma mansoni]|uniref:hypothetical protein n=1 Tax=Schistosoma mansoni TaxID=6183 RepID=UPI00022DC619|nr:hypothetical protein Smp_208040 [Schistosoma mansoni]|eukprot:XP_018650667.1 hypothetical protein Smp_208040 [Schistosoma mansoni]